jgi:hypothetical protein
MINKTIKYTPENIQSLEPNQVIVVGSNTRGIHGAGAAKLAFKKFGAKWGVGRGLQGQTYALPTKDFEINTLPLYDIERNIKEFLDFAGENPHYEFYTTLIGCGLANYTPDQIGPLFGKFPIPSNVILPIQFAKFVKNYNENH